MKLHTSPSHPPDQAPRSISVRAYVGGFLYIEGIVCMLVGCSMLFTYWPPYATPGERANPVSLVGAYITGFAVAYMIMVGLIMFIYSLLKPAVHEEPHPLQARAQRYARIRTVGPYLFDGTISCEADADEAELARLIL